MANDPASKKVVRNTFENGALESEYTEVGGKVEGNRRIAANPESKRFYQIDGTVPF